MAKNSVAEFFAAVYNDKKLQGALHHALVKSAPDVVVEIAKKKGHNFTSAELADVVRGKELSEKELSGAVGGATLSSSMLGSFSLQQSFWGSFTGLRPGGLASTFELTIPGPSFVQVQSPADRDPRQVDDATASAPSAVEIYGSLLDE